MLFKSLVDIKNLKSKVVFIVLIFLHSLLLAPFILINLDYDHHGIIQEELNLYLYHDHHGIYNSIGTKSIS